MATKFSEPPMLGGPFYDFRNDIDDVFFKMRSRACPLPLVAYAPPFELTREGDDYVVRLEVPGSDPEQIDISLMNNTIRVRGSRIAHNTDEDRTVLHSEIARGAFERVLELPEPLRPEEIKTTYKHGVLEVRIRPARKSPKRKLVIQAQ
jgi:HSP20 family protein